MLERDRAVITCDMLGTVVVKLQIAGPEEMKHLQEILESYGFSGDELTIIEKFIHDIRCIDDNGVFVTPCNKQENTNGN